MARSMNLKDDAKPGPVLPVLKEPGKQLPSISPAPWYLSNRFPQKHQRVFHPCNFRKRICNRCSGTGHKAEDCSQPVRTSMPFNGVQLPASGLASPAQRLPNGSSAAPPHWSAASSPPADFFHFMDARGRGEAQLQQAG